MTADRDLFAQAKGYYVTKALLALWRTGLLTRAAGGEELAVVRLGEEGFDRHLLGGLLDYLTTRGYFDWLGDGGYRLSARGRDAAPYFGYLSMMVGAYEPIFANLEAVLSGELTYGRDVRRSSAEMARSLTALEQNLLGQVTDLVRTRRFRKVVDLGCGGARMLCRILQVAPDVAGVGVDCDAETCALAERAVQEQGLGDRVKIVRGDAGDVGALPADVVEDADLVTAMFVMHEVLRQRGRDGTLDCLRALARLLGADGTLVMVEVSRTAAHEAREDLLFVPEYELFHVFSNQRLASQQEWESMLAEAGLRVTRTMPADMCQAICIVASPA